MPVTVWIPTQLRSVTNGNGKVQAKGETVDEVLLDLDRQFPGFRERVVDDRGEVRVFLGIYVNDEDIKFLRSGKTPLADGDEVEIIPAVAGGR